MPVRDGFRKAKARLLRALAAGTYQHEARDRIDAKNLLLAGAVSAGDVAKIVGRCNGTHHSSGPHHADRSVTVHVLRRDGWYVKFYFLEPDATMFISVHR